MIKINPSSTTIKNFKTQILSQFFDKDGTSKRFEKNEKNHKWQITLIEFNTLIKKKFKDYTKEINLEKLIAFDYDELCDLKDYIDTNKSKTKLTKKEKDYFYTLYSRLKKSHYLKDLNVSVCPYCNRNYIFNFNKSNSIEATAQLDHFFDKATYPYFAVSIYNLIPSCQTCNQRKSKLQKDIFHPFVEAFNDDMKFQLKIDTCDFLHDKNSFKIEHRIIKNEQKVNSHIATFNIENLYKEHKDIVLELIQKAQIYNDSYIDELMNNYEGTIFKNKEDLMRLITCGYVNDEDINKRPLSKLMKDVSEELGLI